MIPIIGLHAGLQSGKSTIANRLSTLWGYEEVSFAEPIRRFVAEDVLGIDLKRMEDIKDNNLVGWGCSPRHMMQTLGTDWGRNMVHGDIWIRISRRKALLLMQEGKLVIFSDVRFENEAEMIRSLGGQIWHVKRPLHLRHRSEQAHSHASESGIEFRPDLGDKLVMNESTRGDLLRKVDDLVKAA